MDQDRAGLMCTRAEGLWSLLSGFLLVTGLSLIITLIWESSLGKLYNDALVIVDCDEFKGSKTVGFIRWRAPTIGIYNVYTQCPVSTWEAAGISGDGFGLALEAWLQQVRLDGLWWTDFTCCNGRTWVEDTVGGVWRKKFCSRFVWM